MHELSITQQVLDIAVKKAMEADAAGIKQINLVIGDMSSVVDDCVQFYFDIISKDTIAGKAKLSFRRINTRLRCREGHEFTPAADNWSCPYCQDGDVEVVAGKEFYVDSIEVE